MNALARIPFWGWWIFSTAFLFLLFNATEYNFVYMMQSNVRPEFKALTTVVVLIIASLYIVEGHKTWNAWGIALFVAFFGIIIYVAFKGDWLPSPHWWVPPLGGFFLAFSMQGGRLYRSMTGRVPVSPDTNQDHHAPGHHHGS